jgi:histidinol-phosphate/aromatic aminotransferase/cobyric acid decarboxylase-like protein/SAM-dependent methyltransferase
MPTDDWATYDSARWERSTAAEVAYLQASLDRFSAGRRVIDLDAGIGGRAGALARAGFAVTVLDAAGAAAGLARRPTGGDAREDGRGDPSAPASPASSSDEVDAVICAGEFGEGSDARRRRLLRTLRDHLGASGLLILSVPNALSVAAGPTRGDDVRVEGAVYRLQSDYDPVTGQATEILRVSRPGWAERSLTRLLRRYSPVELVELVRAAGYRILAVDGDLVSGRPPTPASQTVQVVARPVRAPPASLAVAFWRTPPDDRLELRYAPDEAPWLAPAPDAVWKELLARETGVGWAAAGTYPVDDPYGAERGAGVVSACFDRPIPPRRLSFGAGVTSLLRELSALAEGGPVLGARIGHPDLAAWALSSGCTVNLVDPPTTADRLADAIVACGPSIVQLDRPTVLGELLTKGDLERVAAAAHRVGAIVVVDESAASYLGPGASAIPLTGDCDNLIVLRGFTKAYSQAGIRVGFAVTSDALAPRVREMVAPLQVGELSYLAALKLLEAGDIFGRLRARIAETKPRVIAWFEALGLQIRPGHPGLPWFLVRDADASASRVLDGLGIRGLRLVPSPARPDDPVDLIQLFTPLSGERLDRLWQRLRR